MEDTKTIVNKVIDKAISAGANGADLIIRSETSHSLQAQGGKISVNEISDTQMIGLRVVKNGRVGLSYSESFSEADIDLMVAMALTHAEATAERIHQKISIVSADTYYPDCASVWDNAEISRNEKEEMVIGMEALCYKKEKRVKSVPFSSFSEEKREFTVANSNGVRAFKKSRLFSGGVYVLTEDNGKLSDFFVVDATKSFREFDSESCVGRACERAALFLEGETIASGGYDVIFAPNALRSLFAAFSLGFSAKSAMDGVNPLRDKLGEVIGVSGLTVRDVPDYSDSLLFSPFDSEGARSSEIILVKNGILSEFLHNSETSAYYSTSNNARASRTPGSSLNVAPTTTVINTGMDENIRKEPFLEVLKFDGLHSGCDSVSGNFSLQTMGIYHNEGKITPVKGITLSGNFYKMFLTVKGIGETMKRDDTRGFFAPDIRFSDMKVAGGD